jgi:hypothetical protein
MKTISARQITKVNSGNHSASTHSVPNGRFPFKVYAHTGYRTRLTDSWRTISLLGLSRDPEIAITRLPQTPEERKKAHVRIKSRNASARDIGSNHHPVKDKSEPRRCTDR